MFRLTDVPEKVHLTLTLITRLTDYGTKQNKHNLQTTGPTVMNCRRLLIVEVGGGLEWG